MDLSTDDWLHDKYPTDIVERRPLWTATGPDGKAHYGITPTALLLDERHNNRIDIAVYGLLDEKAGASGRAKCTHDELAEVLTVDRSTISRSLTRLCDSGWLTKEKRGWHLVTNPSRRTADSIPAPSTPLFPTITPYPSECDTGAHSTAARAHSAAGEVALAHTQPSTDDVPTDLIASTAKEVRQS